MDPELRPLSAEIAAKRVREARNLEALEDDLSRLRTVWESRPAILEYATTSACNLKCPMCAQADPKRRVQNTPRALRARLYEELLPGTTVLKPFSLSEPLLNDLEELEPYLAEHDVRLDVVTNACLLDERNLALLLPHLHRITFSVDSHIKAIFEKVRPPAVFEEVDANIRRAMPRLKAAGIEARINMVLVRDMLPHLPDFVDHVVDQYGCEYLDVLELVPYMPGACDMDPFTDPGEAAVAAALEGLLARARERRINVDVILREPYAQCCRVLDPTQARRTSANVFEETHQKIRQSHPGFCEQAMTYLKVNPDGESYPCCKAPPELRLGNIFTDGLDAVWNSAVARDLRKRMFLGDYPAPCRDCVFFEFTRATGSHQAPPLRRRLSFRMAEARRRLSDQTSAAARELSAAVRVLRSRSTHACREAACRAGRALGLPKILR